MSRRLKIAYFSPLPPAHSGIADYSATLIEALAPLVDLTLFVDDPTDVADHWRTRFAVEPITAYGNQRFSFDMPLYHMGNNVVQHRLIYQTLLRFPGVVVLHDFNIHGFIYEQTVRRDHQYPAYVTERAYAEGAHGRKAAQQHLIDGQPLDSSHALVNRLVDHSLGVIAHSRYVVERLRMLRDNRPITPINFLSHIPSANSKRNELPWDDNDILFATVGFINPHKQINLILDTFQQLQETVPTARYLFVGDVAERDAFQASIAERRLSEYVYVTGYLPSYQTYLDWIASADVLISLRHPTLGETSASVISGMSLGKPQIVYNHGWYAELPANAVSKIDPDNPQLLLSTMMQLATDRDRRQAMGSAARHQIAQHHQPDQIAKQMVAFIQQIIDHNRSRFHQPPPSIPTQP